MRLSIIYGDVLCVFPCAMYVTIFECSQRCGIIQHDCEGYFRFRCGGRQVCVAELKVSIIELDPLNEVVMRARMHQAHADPDSHV